MQHINPTPGYLAYAVTDRLVDHTGEHVPAAALLQNYWNPCARKFGSFNLMAKYPGYFKDLGIDTLVISTPLQLREPTAEFGIEQYSAYFGYHVTDLYRTDRYMGTFDELANLVEVLGDNGISLMLDTVSHMHEDAPIVREKPNLFRGTAGFSPLRMWDVSQDEARTRLWDSYGSWMQCGKERYKLCGARVDSAHHLDVDYIRRLFGQGGPFEGTYSLLEVLEGDWEKWERYLGTGCPLMYNYPLFYRMVRALACPFSRYTQTRRNAKGKTEHIVFGDLKALADAVKHMWQSGFWNQCLNFLANHDQDLPLSVVYRAYNDNRQDIATARFVLAHTILAMLPGQPGMLIQEAPGYSGPGYREPYGFCRMAVPLDRQPRFGPFFKCLVQARTNHPAARAGTYTELYAPSLDQQTFNDPELWVFLRQCERNKLVIVVNNSDKPLDISRLGGIQCDGIFEEGNLANAIEYPEMFAKEYGHHGLQVIERDDHRYISGVIKPCRAVVVTQ